MTGQGPSLLHGVSGISWEYESPFLEVDYEERCPIGAPSLKHLAMKQTLRDQRNLSQSLFFQVPWLIAKELWDYLRRSGKRTLHLWKIFCTCYPNEFRQVSPFCRMTVDKPSFLMRDYLNLVKSANCDWATQLVIWTEHAFTPELVEIADVINLVSLEVNTGTTVAYQHDNINQAISTVDDRILRTWAELIESSGAFRHLRILKLNEQRHLTETAFLYLSKFPALEYCIVAMCDALTSKAAITTAEAHGWQICQDKPTGAIYDFSERRVDFPTRWRNEVPASLVPPSLPKDIPVLEYIVGQRRERLAASSFVYVFRRTHTNTSERNKRKPEDRLAPIGRKARKPTMKGRGKDLSGLLGEFM
ncbi:hypothetical protein PISL3812_02410 [Talaromyces islandicus]|uniref:Uncharacterized protein n=1 Tax=Talaromyces islandicus TaxID=28573 RepID=A0A0U1LPT8_TALIS|nr:hypothetical protein PISL3812_02410 [Talaromyces islandicus]